MSVSRKAWQIAQTVGDANAEAQFLYVIAGLYQQLGDKDLAVIFCDCALETATTIGIPLAADCAELKGKLTRERIENTTLQNRRSLFS